MAKIRWKVGAKIQTAAVGLEGPTYYVANGDDLEVPDAALKKLAEIYGPDSFEVVKEEAPKKRSGKLEG